MEYDQIICLYDVKFLPSYYICSINYWIYFYINLCKIRYTVIPSLKKSRKCLSWVSFFIKASSIFWISWSIFPIWKSYILCSSYLVWKFSVFRQQAYINAKKTGNPTKIIATFPMKSGSYPKCSSIYALTVGWGNVIVWTVSVTSPNCDTINP